jgi:hypothetical protein
MLRETFGSNFEVSSIFKPKVDEDLGKHGKGITKQDHIVIVGGPGISLDRQYHFAIEEDLNQLHCREDNEYKCGFFQPPEEA